MSQGGRGAVLAASAIKLLLFVHGNLVYVNKPACEQVVVQLAVDQSRHICSAVARGDIDVGIIGGHVPEELKDIVKVGTLQLRIPLDVLKTCNEPPPESSTICYAACK